MYLGMLPAMTDRAVHVKASFEELMLDHEGRISLRGDVLLGWEAEKRETAPYALTTPASLFAASPTTAVVYACNLPAPLIHGRTPPLDLSGQLPSNIGREFESDFVSSSYPGGQVAIVKTGGEKLTMQFRWICVTAHASIGSVWRFFVRIRSRNLWYEWRAIPHDYLFGSGGSAVLNPPGNLFLPLASDAGLTVRLAHPDGMLTCFPCTLGRVKVTRLDADGWPERQLMRLMLDGGNRIVAFFSDGAQKTIGRAASSGQRAARA